MDSDDVDPAAVLMKRGIILGVAILAGTTVNNKGGENESTHHDNDDDDDDDII